MSVAHVENDSKSAIEPRESEFSYFGYVTFWRHVIQAELETDTCLIGYLMFSLSVVDDVKHTGN